MKSSLTDREVAQRRLEDAVMAVTMATDSRGLYIRLCSSPMSIDAVRNDLARVAGWFRDPGQTVWLDDGERAAVQNLKLLSTLLEAHLAAIQ